MSKKNRSEEEYTPEVTQEEVKEVVRARVVPDRLNLRRGPSTTSDVLYILNKDELVNIEDERNDWTYVHYVKQNIRGYVMSHLIRKE